MLQTVSRIVDLLDPSLNRIGNMSVDEARRRVLDGEPRRRARDRRILRARGRRRRDRPAGAVARSPDALLPGQAARGARALRRRPHRHAARARSTATASAGQFHPSYTRMVPAHYVVEIALVGCPDPDPDLHALLHAAGQRAAGDARRDRPAATSARMAREIEKWLRHIEARLVAAGTHRRRASRAASTAARSFSSPTTRCSGWASRPPGSRPSS